MHQAAQEYLKRLNAGAALVTRVEAAIGAYEFLCRSEPDEIFVCDAIDETGTRGFSSIWGFYEFFWMEAREHGSSWDVDISSYEDGILYLGVQYENLQLPDEVSEDSRLSVEIQTNKVGYSSMSAVGLNCQDLLEIIAKRFLPNLSHSK